MMNKIMEKQTLFTICGCDIIKCSVWRRGYDDVETEDHQCTMTSAPACFMMKQ